MNFVVIQTEFVAENTTENEVPITDHQVQEKETGIETENMAEIETVGDTIPIATMKDLARKVRETSLTEKGIANKEKFVKGKEKGKIS